MADVSGAAPEDARSPEQIVRETLTHHQLVAFPWKDEAEIRYEALKALEAIEADRAALVAARDAALDEQEPSVWRDRAYQLDGKLATAEIALAEAVAARDEARRERDEWAGFAGRDIRVALTRAEAAEASRDAAVEALRDLLDDFGVELDDSRLGYVVVQISRPALDAARAVLAGLNPDGLNEGEGVRTTTRSSTSRQGPSERAPAPSLSPSSEVAAEPEGHEAASPMYRQERDRWLIECECGWEYNGRSKDDCRWAHVYHLHAVAEVAAGAAPEREGET